MPPERSVGLTERMKDALENIVTFVANHGVMPSRRSLASAMGLAPTRADVLITSIAERGGLTTHPESGKLIAFGSDGVAFFIPPHLASALCRFCLQKGESPLAVVADAISLHIDALDGVEP